MQMEPTESDAALEMRGSTDSRGQEGLLLIIGMVLPSVITYIFFVAVADQPSWLQQTVAAVGKMVQFALPLVWWFGVRRMRLGLPKPSTAGMTIGIAFGCVISAAIWIGYWQLIEPANWCPRLAGEVARKVTEIGCNTPLRFVLLGCFYVLIHSLLEEYYWRWFVFGGLRDYLPIPAAILISSAGFMAHHVIVLARFFGWQSPATWLFSLAVGIGGAFWAWLYQRSGQLGAPWISHLIVDAGIFILGYQLALACFG